MPFMRLAQEIPYRNKKTKTMKKNNQNNGYHDLKPTIWIGKQGISESLIEEIQGQIKIRKVIKIKWLASTDLEPSMVASASGTKLLQVRGRTMVLGDYKLYNLPSSRNI